MALHDITRSADDPERGYRMGERKRPGCDGDECAEDNHAIASISEYIHSDLISDSV